LASGVSVPDGGLAAWAAGAQRQAVTAASAMTGPIARMLPRKLTRGRV
jgi:hypothetical protein